MQRRKAFTFLELIAVMIITATIAAVVLPRLGGEDADLMAEAKALRARLRHVQMTAMSRNAAHGLAFDEAGRNYWLFASSAPTTRLILPGENADTVALPSGFSVAPGGSVVSFDSWGVPCSDSAATSELAADLVLTMTKTKGGQSDSDSITVTQETGYVP